MVAKQQWPLTEAHCVILWNMPVRSSYLHRPSCYAKLNPTHALMEMWTHIISHHNKTIGLRSPGSLIHQTHLRTRSTSGRCLRGIMYCCFFSRYRPFNRCPNQPGMKTMSPHPPRYLSPQCIPPSHLHSTSLALPQSQAHPISIIE